MDKKRLSTYMTKLLRHSGRDQGLNINEYGFVKISELIAFIKGQSYWSEVTTEDISHIVKTCKKQRFEIEGDKIGARYGHSFPVKLREKKKELPSSLWHGTNEEALKRILDLNEGILPMNRQSVHLSETTDFATLAAKRRKNPRLLLVDTQKALELGVKFEYAGNEVWLSSPIPASCITLKE